MTYEKVNDENINGDCQFLEMYILQVILNLKVLFTDSFGRWNVHCEIGLNE